MLTELIDPDIGGGILVLAEAVIHDHAGPVGGHRPVRAMQHRKTERYRATSRHNPFSYMFHWFISLLLRVARPHHPAPRRLVGKRRVSTRFKQLVMPPFISVKIPVRRRHQAEQDGAV